MSSNSIAAIATVTGLPLFDATGEGIEGSIGNWLVKSTEPFARYGHSFSFLSIDGDRDLIRTKDAETIGELV